MPDARLRRTRASLPEGYQYGDAAKGVLPLPLGFHREAFRVAWSGEGCANCGQPGTWDALLAGWHCLACGARWITGFGKWRAPHENAAAQLRRNQSSTFRLGVDTCPTCGTTGKYDCPDCGIPFYGKRNAQRTGEETV